MLLLVLRKLGWSSRRFDGDIDGLIYRVEMDHRLLAIAAALKLAIVILTLASLLNR